MDESVGNLTAAIASGDPEAFARFYRAWFDFMLAEARRITGRDESFCLDVVHDAMLRVIRSMKKLDSVPRLRGWLRVVIRTTAYDKLRSERRRHAREAATSTPDLAAPAATDDERLHWLRREIETLDEPGTQLLLMRLRFGWSLERIGKALELSPGAVDGRLRRLVSLLRRRRPKELLDES